RFSLPGAGVARVVAIEPPWHVHRRVMDRKQRNKSERNNSTDAIKILGKQNNEFKFIILLN
ncbi:hypothetical protein QQF21_07090, partial [Lelliottia sp. V89_10]|uniref:hypothetical protein n=1 Tax=Lelliottia wanjuensis TaxID=3050585 RepID=UPI00255038AC